MKRITEWIGKEVRTSLGMLVIAMMVMGAALFWRGCGLVGPVTAIIATDSPEGMLVHTQAELEAADVVLVRTADPEYLRKLWSMAGWIVVEPEKWHSVIRAREKLNCQNELSKDGFDLEYVGVLGFVLKPRGTWTPICFSTGPYTRSQARKWCKNSMNRELYQNTPDIRQIICGPYIIEGQGV